MRKSLLLTLVVLFTAVCLALPSPAWARKPPKYSGYEDAETLSIGTNIEVPVTSDSAGYIQSIGATWYPIQHLMTNLKLGWALNDQVSEYKGDAFCFGNIVLGVSSPWWTKNQKGFNLTVRPGVAFGIGPVDTSNDGRALTARQAQIVSQGWLGFRTESFVIKPYLAGGITFGAGSKLTFSLGPSFAVPMKNKELRGDYEANFEYDVHLNIGSGDFRGGFGFYFGISGMTDLKVEIDEVKSSYNLDLGIYLHVRRLRTFFGATIPINKGDKAGVLASVGLSVSWEFDFLCSTPTCDPPEEPEKK